MIMMMMMIYICVCVCVRASVFVCVCVLNLRFPVGELKKIEICRSISRAHVKHMLIFVH